MALDLLGVDHWQVVEYIVLRLKTQDWESSHRCQGVDETPLMAWREGSEEDLAANSGECQHLKDRQRKKATKWPNYALPVIPSFLHLVSFLGSAGCFPFCEALTPSCRVHSSLSYLLLWYLLHCIITELLVYLTVFPSRWYIPPDSDSFLIFLVIFTTLTVPTKTFSMFIEGVNEI